MVRSCMTELTMKHFFTSRRARHPRHEPTAKMHEDVILEIDAKAGGRENVTRDRNDARQQVHRLTAMAWDERHSVVDLRTTR